MFSFFVNIYITDSWTSIRQVLESIATIIAAGFAVVIYCINKRKENNQYWNDNLPVVTLWSPCDVTQNACDINLLDNSEDEKGSCLFKLGNFSKTTAWNLTIDFYSDLEHCNKLYSTYIQEIPITQNSEWWIPIYSKYAVNPLTKEISYQEFNLTESLCQCCCDQNNQKVKKLYAQCTYFSSPDHNIAIELQTYFEIRLKCEEYEIIILSIIRTLYCKKSD